MKDQRAFLTGSRVYGNPREDSDIDLVVLANADAIENLARLQGKKADGQSGDGIVSASLRFGNLNLILMDDPGLFEVWRAGTEHLKTVANDDLRYIPRDEAVAYLTAKQEEYLKTLPEGTPV